jgi:sulfate/thiosulfate transport system ATP-binding protein
MSQVEQHRHRRHGDVPVGDPSGIVVRGVNRSFGDFVALEDINLEVRPGGLTALLGPSGGGKSTLLRIIAGLDYPDSGSVEIAGRDATFLPPQRRSVGFVFQHYAAFKHLTTARNVAFGLEIRRRPKAEIRDRVAELLQLVHLEQFAERLPSQLSGGQRQRMALARALAVQPEVLLLDEPFGALDAQVRKELRDWLRRLHDEVHVTTLFVTHDQEEALEVADEIVVINGGRIEQVGSPADLYDHPANAFVMSFLGPVTRLAGTLVRPHDLEVLTDERAGAVQATVTKLLRVGYEVRVETSTAGGETPWVQLTRAQVEELGLATGQTVWLRALVATPFAATEGAAAREAARGGDAAGSSDAHAGPDAAGDPLPTTTVRA